jgi:hypothetical protein
MATRHGTQARTRTYPRSCHELEVSPTAQSSVVEQTHWPWQQEGQTRESTPHRCCVVVVDHPTKFSWSLFQKRRGSCPPLHPRTGVAGAVAVA